MKFLFLIFIIISCGKEVSYEKQCGIITDKKIGVYPKKFIFEIDSVKQISVGLFQYNKYEENQKYCW